MENACKLTTNSGLKFENWFFVITPRSEVGARGPIRSYSMAQWDQSKRKVENCEVTEQINPSAKQL